MSSVQTIVRLPLRLGVSGNRYFNCVRLVIRKKKVADALRRAQNFADEKDLESHSRLCY